jgi:hypothetical protein
MIKVIVYQTALREMKGTSAKSGRPYHLRIQNAYAVTVDKDGNTPPVPEKFEISLDSDQPVYQPGEYTLHPSAIYVDRDGRLAISPRLAPAPKAATPRTA